MQEWRVDFYRRADGKSPIEEWLDSIPTDAKTEVIRILFLLKEHGIRLGMPYVRPIEDKLYEIRAKEKDGIYRVFYFAHTGKRFVMLHGFMKKTQQTPRKEIEIAKERMKEVRNG